MGLQQQSEVPIDIAQGTCSASYGS